MQDPSNPQNPSAGWAELHCAPQPAAEQGSAAQVKERLNDALPANLSEAKASLEGAKRQAAAFIDEHPVASVGIALGAGYALGWAVKRWWR